MPIRNGITRFVCVCALLGRFMFVFQLNINLLNSKSTTSVAFLESKTDSGARSPTLAADVTHYSRFSKVQI